MKCIVSNPNIKRFGRAITALGKLGDVVYVDLTSDWFLLHTINSSRSAYGSFKFLPDFFSTFSIPTQVNCKVSIKSCFMVFKSLVSMDKNTDQCIFEFPNDKDSLCIKLLCKHGIVKVYTIPFIECETLKTSFQISRNKNFLCADSKLFFDTIQNFQSSVEEVTIKMSEDRVSLKNFTEDEKDPSRVVHTEVSYEIEEFSGHKFENDAEITFCLKEFKAFLSFVEGFDLPLKILYHEAGHPIAFTVDSSTGMQMEVTFIMSTMASYSGSESQSQRPKSEVNSSAFGASSQVLNRTCSTLQTESGLDNAVIDLTVGDEEDEIPSTPPRKRLRNDFLGLRSEFPFSSMISQPDPVLAKDSDEEDN